MKSRTSFEMPGSHKNIEELGVIDILNASLFMEKNISPKIPEMEKSPEHFLEICCSFLKLLISNKILSATS